MINQIAINLKDNNSTKKIYEFINKYSKDLEAEIDIDGTIFIKTIYDTILA